MMRLRESLDVDCRLGESPRWDADRAVFLWVDVPVGTLWSWRPSGGEPEKSRLREPTTSVALTTSPGALVVTHFESLAVVREGVSKTLAAPALRSGQRFNDSGVDPLGHVWAATLVPSKAPVNGLFEYVPGSGLLQRDRGIRAGNGIAWSPDGAVMYLVDSGARSIFRYERNPTDGAISRRTLFAEFREDEGVPDGLAVDLDGTLWCAMWGAASLVRLAADGRLMERTLLPVAYPSSCAFGGDDMSLLLVTSARMRPRAKAKGHDGRPLLFETRSTGAPANRVSLEV